MSEEKKMAVEVKWRIENIQSWLQKRDDTLYSPQFLAKTLKNTCWRLRLSPNWQLAEKYASFTLQRDIEDNGPELIDLNYEISFLSCDGSPIKSKSHRVKFASKTVSHELNVKQGEILAEKKDTYLPEGVLTVSCKLWYTWSAVSEEVHCLSLRSVIGTKCINVNATIDDFNRSSYAIVNFSPPSTDINLISLDIFMRPEGNNTRRHEFTFKRRHIECKNLSWYSLRLFALGIKGRKKEFYEIFNFAHDQSSAEHHYMEYPEFCPKYLPSNTLNVELELSYHPGIVSECSEGEFISNEILSRGAVDLETVIACNPKIMYYVISDGLTSTDLCYKKSKSKDENECFDAAEKKCLPITTLKEDMASLYSDRLFCDTKLQTDTETFPAHRNVLSARSPVFKKMFTTDMKEKAGECINVPDISSDTMRRMLQYIYTDSTADLEIQNAKDLYVASDKYDIASLKQFCSSFIKENLFPTNVCEILLLADKHMDKDLEFAAQEYILTNDEEVFYSDEWKLFMKEYGSLAAQVMYLKFTKK